MAIVKCSECGNDVSTKADKCVHCGAPVQAIEETVAAPEKKEEKGVGFNPLRLIFIMFIALAAYAFFTSGGNDSKPKSATVAHPKRAVVFNSEWDGSVRQVKRYLLNQLKDPDSFEAIDWSPVKQIDRPDAKFMVRCQYRAKNSYGGYVVSNQLFYLDGKGNVVRSVDWKQP